MNSRLHIHWNGKPSFCWMRNPSAVRSGRTALRFFPWALCICLSTVLLSSARAAPEGCSDATVAVQVQAEDDTYTYYVVSSTVAPDARAKKEKASRVTLEIEGRIAAEGVDKSGAPYREEVPLHFRLRGVRYGAFSRTVKGPIQGPRVNRHVFGVTIQSVSCVWQDPSDETEDNSVN